jgi:dienelactone hydrolase
MPYREFDEPFAHGGIRHRVFTRGNGPAVIIMHEITGLGPECVALGDRIAALGYSVYLPLFFGEFGVAAKAKVSQGLAVGRICVSKEFHCFAKNETSPIADWLRGLTREVARRSRGPVAAIGMCLSGGFVLAMMIENDVVAPISCQPALPLRLPLTDKEEWATSLGLAPRDIAAAKARHDAGCPLLAVRYETDKICPKGRLDRMQREFTRMERVEIPAERPKHASLTVDFSEVSYDAVRRFLERHLPPMREPGRVI